ncbi:MAG: 50S ribosomal protein L1 [Chloroflexi bacterium]|nr:50S ribosomal protein L1 [Chloroflexota bacterium]
MPKRGKRYRGALESYNKESHYPPAEAVALIKQMATAKFDETVELHIRTGLDVRHADQQLRGTARLPHGLGKEVRVAVFAEGDAASAATEAGAEIVGSDDLIERVQDGFTEFDVAVAQRALMGKVGRHGRVLGPRGLIPNPRAGTVVDRNDVAKAVGEAKAGRVEFRTDREASVHVPLGKASFGEDQLLENLATMVSEIVKARPSGSKGSYIRSLNIASTMGPGVKLEQQSTLALKVD